MKLIDEFTIYSDFDDESVKAQIDHVMNCVKAFCNTDRSGGFWPNDGEKCIIVDGDWGEICRGDMYIGPTEVDVRVREILEEIAYYMKDNPEETEGGKTFAHTTLKLEISDGNKIESVTEITLSNGDGVFHKIIILRTVTDINADYEG